MWLAPGHAAGRQAGRVEGADQVAVHRGADVVVLVHEGGPAWRRPRTRSAPTTVTTGGTHQRSSRSVGLSGPPRAPPSTTGVAAASGAGERPPPSSLSSLIGPCPALRWPFRPASVGRTCPARGDPGARADRRLSFHHWPTVRNRSRRARPARPDRPDRRSTGSAPVGSAHEHPEPAHAPPRTSPTPSAAARHPRWARCASRLGAAAWPRRSAATSRRASPTATPLVTGVQGFEDTVLPQLETAVLAGHDVILLGERGQAKTRLIRSLVDLLDEWLPDRRAAPRSTTTPTTRLAFARPWSAERATTRPSPGSTAAPATARSWPRPTRRSPTSSARSTPSRWPRAATSPTS